MPTSGHVQRAEIYPLVSDNAEKPRPVVVVSRDQLNNGMYVVVVPFYSQQLEKRKRKKYCAFFSAGEGDLDRDCVAKADEIAMIQKTDLQLSHRIGRFNAAQMSRIIEAIRYVIRDDE